MGSGARVAAMLVSDSAQARAARSRVEVGLVPSIKEMQSYVGLSKFPRFFGMHVEAVGATVHLRNSRFDEGHELVIQSTRL